MNIGEDPRVSRGGKEESNLGKNRGIGGSGEKFFVLFGLEADVYAAFIQLQYRALDQAGNVSEIGNCAVRIDTVKPRTRAPWRVNVRRGRWAKVRYKVVDNWPKTGRATVWIKVRTLSGRSIFTKRLANIRVNRWTTKKIKINLRRGKYRFYIYAWDAAKNKSVKMGQNTLRVR